MDIFCKLLRIFEGIEIFPIEYLKKDYLEEYAIQELINQTDDGRLKRAVDIRTQPPRVTKDYKNDYKLIEFNFKSRHSTTGDRAKGYMIANSSGDVKEMFCSCKDFRWRLHWTAVKHKLSRWNIPARFLNPKTGKCNRQPPVITNPDGKLYICKHLAALKNYLSEK